MNDLDIEIAVLIPCRDEQATIQEVVKGFQIALPEASVYVYDNGSKDDTASEALKAGAILGFEPLQGKGRVVRRMFAEIEADVYVIVDGDGTYSPEEAPLLVKTLVDEDKSPGYYSIVWDGTNDSGDEVSSGVYFCQMYTPKNPNGGQFIKAKKMVKIR